MILNGLFIDDKEDTIGESDIFRNKIETMLGKVGVYIDGFYFCRDYSDGIRISSENRSINYVDYNCSEQGLILRACKDFNARIEDSWIIGDYKTIECIKDIGCNLALIGKEKCLKANIFEKSYLDAIMSIFCQ